MTETASSPLQSRPDDDRSSRDTKAVSTDRFVPFEGRLYDQSPLGFWGTTIAIFGVTFGSFLLIALFTGRPPLLYPSETGFSLPWETSGQTYRTPDVLHIGFTLSCILTTALALVENGRRLWAYKRPALMAVLPETAHRDVEGLTGGVPGAWRTRYMLFFLLGALGGVSFNIVMMVSMDASPGVYLTSIGLWFLIFSPPLYGLGLRSGVDLNREGSEIKRLIRTHLVVDLHDLEALEVFGRLGLHAALSWFIMGAVLLLFVINPDQIWYALPGCVLSVGGGLFIFYSAVQPVREKIMAAKAEAMRACHAEMKVLRDRGSKDDMAALGGLSAYCQWVENRSDWPISSTTSLRILLYILIPVLPILGSYLFERLADSLIS